MKQNSRERHVLNVRQKRFALEIRKDLSATRAAIRAGYSSKTAPRAGMRLLRNGAILAQIEKSMNRRAERSDEILRAIAKIAFANICDYIQVEADGSVRFDFSTLSETTAAGITVTVSEHTEGRGQDAVKVRRTTVKLPHKLRALKLLGRHPGLFKAKDKHDLGPNSNVYAELSRVLALEKLSDAELQELQDRLHLPASVGKS